MKLLRLFLANPGSPFYVRELVRKAESQIHAIRRELDNLERLGIVRSAAPPSAVGALRERMRKYYELDDGFSLVQELRSLILRSQFLAEEECKRRIRQLGNIRYLALLGSFVGDGGTESSVDMLIVGQLNRKRLARVFRQFERSFDRPLNYAVFSEREFRYRWDVGDRFLYGILGGKKIVVIDEITPAAHAAVAATQ